ncbi:RhuM family protein [Corynebacterium pygosceleis]|uniref:RhuM family protein n=1 Tax=Corynebacterium pygosceleis TaxID=2800406 RepID=UPI001903A681|nr:RhuM family protein [Corynebacterium pygosceleis]MCL0120663.1 virulence RhuM family protein [Corynebacterium pygosceleis]
MTTEPQPPELDRDQSGEFIIYRTEDDRTEVHLRLIDGSVWMTQAQIAELFGISRQNASVHIRNIYADGDLTRDRTIKNYLIVRSEGDRDIRRRVDHYNLDLIIAVGYRVRGPRGAQFRSWATEVLKEYLIKGFAMNDEKLKDPTGKDYFSELLERIRDIRASEARFYQQILDLVATAVDYSPEAADKLHLFQKIQNKLHFAIAGQTAPEILATRSDPSKPNMGLQTFSGSKVRKKDITVAKNYLVEEELKKLNRFTTMYLDYAEQQAERRVEMTMQDWITQTDKFIQFNEYPMLEDAGRITRKSALDKVHERYTVFDRARRADLDEKQLEEQITALKIIDQQILADQKRLNRR